MTGKKQTHTNPLTAMWKAPKPPASEVETHIDICNDLLERAGASLTERSAAADGKSKKTSRRSRGGQCRPKGKHGHKEPDDESVTDAFETKLGAVANTKMCVEGRRKDLMVDYQERRRRRQSEQLVVEFPHENVRAHRAQRSFSEPDAPPMTKESRKDRLKNNISDRTAETEVSFDEAIEELGSKDREKKKKRKKKKKEILGDFTDQLDWSESSIVWGDEECSCEECSSDEESPQPKDPGGVNFSTSTMFRRSTDGGRSVLSGSSSRRSRDPTCSRSVMSADLNVSFRSVDSRSKLWQSLSTMNVSRKKLEP